MDLEQLRAFLAVIETGSLFTAARMLRVSRATLRRRIEELEVRAGVPLLHRTRVGATATPAGALLAAHGRQLMQEADAVLTSIREVGNEPAGELRVRLPVGLPPHLLTPIFALLSARYPRLRFRVSCSDNPVGGLLTDVDLAVHFGARSPPGPWQVRELLRVPVRLIGSTDYLQRRGAPRSLAELRAHELFACELPGEDGAVWPLRDGGTFTVSPRLITTEIHWLRQCVIAGLGLALVPDVLLPDPGLAPGSVAQVLPELIGREVPVYVVVPKALADLPKVRALTDLFDPLLDQHMPLAKPASLKQP